MRILKLKTIVAASALVACVAVGLDAVERGPADGSQKRIKGAGWVTFERVMKAEKGAGEAGNWLVHGRTFNEQRFSPLKGINDKNVGELGLAWSFKLDIDRGTEATPIVVDGIMFTTGAFSIVYALDARTGKLLWKYDPKVPRSYARHACCDVVNRGVAVWEGRVYVGTLDGYLVSLDALTGRVAWKVDTILNRRRAYTITGAPRIAGRNIVIGNGGAEFGVRGYVTAYELKTGKQAWRFFTVPGDPKKPFESPAMARAAETWKGDKWWEYGGGGTVWDSMAYDPELKLLYIGVGNGSPWTRQHRSPGGGDNLFLSSIVALNPETGEYVWHYQTTPGDNWDYTATQHMILADLAIDGRTRQVIMQAPKNGFFYVLDRRTGELISAEKYVQVTWASHVDKKTGRPVEIAAAADYSSEPKLVWPSPYGGHSWQPMSFSPLTGLVYIPAQDAPFLFAADPDFRIRRRGFNAGIASVGVPEDAAATKALLDATNGMLIAWDPVKQKEAWRVPYDDPMNGGVLSTAGNLVLCGTVDGRFIAYSADKGERLWEASAQTGIIAPPITYSVGDEQFVSVMAGWGGVVALIGGEIARAAGVRGFSHVLTYKLGGRATVAPLQPEPEPSDPPALTADEKTVEKGRELYHQYCMFCHGLAAVGGGVIQDLRSLSADRHKSFIGIVLNGLPAKGMPSYADYVTTEEIRAIQAYVIKRAHDARAAQKPQ